MGKKDRARLISGGLTYTNSTNTFLLDPKTRWKLVIDTKLPVTFATGGSGNYCRIVRGTETFAEEGGVGGGSRCEGYEEA